MVDLDKVSRHAATSERASSCCLLQIVVDVSREQLPEWNAGSTEDPRLKLFYTDALAWLEQDDSVTGKFDVIVMDIADPIEAGPGIALYTQEFYQLAKRKLTPGGVVGFIVVLAICLTHSIL